MVPQIYFTVLIYSYAIHLRKGSYRSLPHTMPASSSQYMALNGTSRHYPDTNLGDDDDDVEDFYRTPARTPASAASFADFVAAPGSGTGRRFRTGGAGTAKGFGNGFPAEDDMEEEVLFDSDELAGGQSKLGTEESASVSSEDGPQQDNAAWRQSFGRDHPKLAERS